MTFPWKPGSFRFSPIFVVAVFGILFGCSHSEPYRYSTPNAIYEPVFLTLPPDPEIEKFRSEDYLLTQFDRYFTGDSETVYAGPIESVTVTASEAFLISQGYLPKSVEYQTLANSMVNYDRVDPVYPEPYRYEWYEWSQINPPIYPDYGVSLHVYSYDPYNPWWYDPYPYSRVYSYHAPFHYSHHYLHGFHYFPHYYYFPYHHFHRRPNPRQQYVVEKPREERTGVKRNPAPSLPKPVSSSRLRLNTNDRFSPPSMGRIFTSPQRSAVKSMQRSSGVYSNSRSSSFPGLQIETTKPSGFGMSKVGRSPSSSPSRSASPARQSPRSGASTYTKPSR